jgi:hypothetical protein
VSERERTSLDGTWEFRPDPDDEGRPAWATPGADWSGATTMPVPAAWQERDRFREYAGVAWYRHTVERERPPDGRAFLRFGAVDHHATVYLDGEQVGEHRGGYLPFEVEVTEHLDAGEHVLAVRVADPGDDPEILHGKQGGRWYTPVSGIWQSVDLIERPATHVADLRVTPDLDAAAARAVVDVDGPGVADCEAVVTVSRDGDPVTRERAAVQRVTDEDGADARPTAATGRAETTLSIPDPDPWSPADPALYDVAVELRRDGERADRFEDYFGMRDIAVVDGELFLNGDPLFVRGALDQGYYPETLYRPPAPDTFEREVRTATDLGFNLLRKHVKPPHPDFLEAADRQGILVWAEPASPDVDTERSRGALREQVRGMVARDYNRPSVVAWSLYNEEWGLGGADGEASLWEDRERQRHLADLVGTLREWDPTRLVCDNSGWAHVDTDINDYHEYVVSPERAGVWDDRLDDIEQSPAENYAAGGETADQAARIVSEFGTWGMPDVGALRERREGAFDWADRAVAERGAFADAGGVDERFADLLADTFEGYAALAATWQAREHTSNRAAVERMRARDIQGYVLTEFSDIEWEFNGVLDYDREPKAFHEAFAAVNAPLAVAVRPDRHAAWADEAVACDVVVSNHTTDPVDAAVAWDAFGESGTVDVPLDGFGSVTVADAIAVPSPAVDGVERRTVRASLDCGAGSAAVEEALVVVERGAGREQTAVYAEGDLADRLAGAGHRVVADPGAAEAAVVTSLDGVRPAVEAGTDAVLVPDADGRFADPAPFDARELAAGASWTLAAALPYHDDSLLAPVADGETPGWAVEGIAPYDLLEPVDGDRVRVGYVEGWLANPAAALVARRLGDGTVTGCAFRVGPAYGEHPVATYLLDGLLAGR